jgi:cephalosporin hydroxylase
MKAIIKIDLKNDQVIVENEEGAINYAMNTPEAFSLISQAWLRAGWAAKYVYSFTWMGRPMIQLPEDMIRLQELIYSVKPDVIIETGVAHGGSLVFYASLCKAMGRGRVVGIDIEIRPHNRKAIEEHELFGYITLIEGSSVDESVVAGVRAQIGSNDKVMVFLDSDHSKNHVLAELNAYAPLVTKGSYIVAMDGIMGQLTGAPRTKPDWSWNNPREAAREFVSRHADFALVEPPFPFNEGAVTQRITYWPDGIINRVR